MFNFLYLDAAPLYSIYFQEEATLSMIGIRDLHDNIFFYILFILIFVTYFIIINTYHKDIQPIRK